MSQMEDGNEKKKKPTSWHDHRDFMRPNMGNVQNLSPADVCFTGDVLHCCQNQQWSKDSLSLNQAAWHILVL